MWPLKDTFNGGLRVHFSFGCLMKTLYDKASVSVSSHMFRSTPYSSIPDRYIPYLPEELTPVWKIRK